MDFDIFGSQSKSNIERKVALSANIYEEERVNTDGCLLLGLFVSYSNGIDRSSKNREKYRAGQRDQTLDKI